MRRVGAGMDVCGFQQKDLADETRDLIGGTLRRADFKAEFPRLTEDRAIRKLDCHIAGHRGLGFNDEIAGAPFAD